MIDRFYKEHKWPRLVEVTYLGRGFDYQEVEPDETLIEELREVIKKKLEKI